MAVDHSTMTTLIGAGDTLAAVLGGLAGLVGTVGGLIWQDRRPHQGDQARAYRSAHKAAAAAAKRRVQYDAAVAELDRARAVADALDTEPEEPDEQDDVADPALAQQERIAGQMAADAARMEQAVKAFSDLVDLSGARVGRAVATITGQQPAVAASADPPAPPRPQRAPVPGRGVPSASQDNDVPLPQDAGVDSPTGPLPTFEELLTGRPSLDYRPPRERRRGPQHPPNQ